MIFWHFLLVDILEFSLQRDKLYNIHIICEGGMTKIAIQKAVNFRGRFGGN